VPDPRVLIAANLRLETNPVLPEIRTYRAHPASGLGRFTAGDAAPYWAHVWAGGAVLARYILHHPESVRGRNVLDLGSGSGVVGIAAALSGAASVKAADIDRFAIAATQLNAEANGVAIETLHADLLDGPAPACDLILAGDVFYAEAFARRVTAALDRWAIEAFVGDMGRQYLPRDRLEALATYDVPDFGVSEFVGAAAYRFIQEAVSRSR
jgi:predicted nicotinamide N-methyase